MNPVGTLCVSVYEPGKISFKVLVLAFDIDKLFVPAGVSREYVIEPNFDEESQLLFVAVCSIVSEPFL